jgi:hypothetical protein
MGKLAKNLKRSGYVLHKSDKNMLRSLAMDLFSGPMPPEDKGGRDKIARSTPRMSIAFKLTSGVQGRMPSGVRHPILMFLLILFRVDGKKW